MAAVTICSDSGAPKNKFLIVSIVSPPICHEAMEPDAMNFALSVFHFNQFFHSLLYFHQEALQFLLTFYHKGGVICISEVINISPNTLDSNLCFIQFSI